MRPTMQRLARARELAHAARLDLPAPLLTHVERLLAAGEPSRAALLALLEGSPPFAARAVRMANSANVAPQVPVDTLGDTLDRLGAGFVARIAHASSRVRRSPACRSVAEDLAATRLEETAVATADAARELARRSGSVDPEAAFLGGLLRDIGHVVLLETIGVPYAGYLLEDGIRKADLARELGLAGATHEDVGAVLAYDWNVPPALAHLLGSHHSDPRGDLVATVAAAGSAARRAASVAVDSSASTLRLR